MALVYTPGLVIHKNYADMTAAEADGYFLDGMLAFIDGVLYKKNDAVISVVQWNDFPNGLTATDITVSDTSGCFVSLGNEALDKQMSFDYDGATLDVVSTTIGTDTTSLSLSHGTGTLESNYGTNQFNGNIKVTEDLTINVSTKIYTIGIDTFIANNCYYDSGWKFSAAGFAYLLQIDSLGEIYSNSKIFRFLHSSTSGVAAGDSITWSDAEFNFYPDGTIDGSPREILPLVTEDSWTAAASVSSAALIRGYLYPGNTIHMKGSCATNASFGTSTDLALITGNPFGLADDESNYFVGQIDGAGVGMLLKYDSTAGETQLNLTNSGSYDSKTVIVQAVTSVSLA